ncbi:MAG: type II toxin-antitoxin system Phd/YefM family antitoxin [Phycisphaerales bacterium]|nr:type II toxin-antitoxin system Phd/YefM family antitoxin [Phycisphaerales bacterium]
MPEITVSASELRDQSADLLERVERGQGRVLIRKYNKDQAYLISARELHALEETVAVLENQSLMRNVVRGKLDMQDGRVQDAAEAFAELDAEFRNEGE